MAVVACGGCGARNRVDTGRVGMKPVCGRCGAELPAASEDGAPIEVSDATFGAAVLGAGARPVLVDFWAPWCPPCRALAPDIDRLAAESGGRYRVAKLDVDRNPETAQRYGVQSIPTLLIFKNGQVVDQMVGAQRKEAIEARLAAAAAGSPSSRT